MTERLQKCINGSIPELFLLLKDWSREELQALLADIDAYHEEAVSTIDEAYRKAVFEPANFLSAARSKQIDDARKAAHVDALVVCSEIIIALSNAPIQRYLSKAYVFGLFTSLQGSVIGCIINDLGVPSLI